MAFIPYQQLREVNAFDYLVQYEGFNISNKSNKSWAASGGVSGAAVIEHPTTGAKFLVKKDAQYSNEFRITSTDGINIPTGRGSSTVVDLISFVAWLHNDSFPNAAQAIAGRVPSLAIPIFSDHAVHPKPIEQSDLTIRVQANLKPLTNTTYLQQRHIKPEIIHDDILFGRMGLYKTRLHDNFCFHCYDTKDNFVTTCQRYFLENKGMKLFPAFKDNETGLNHSPSTIGTIFRSNMPECENPILLFSESPEDALSYYQLHYEELQGKTFIASSMGTFRNDQAQMLSKICQENQISKIILANDNDAAGINFDILALCAITPYGAAVPSAPFLKGSCVKVNSGVSSEAESVANQHSAYSTQTVGNKINTINTKARFKFEFSTDQLDYATKLYDLLDKSIFSNANRISVTDGLVKDEKISKNWILQFDCKNDKLHLEDVQHILAKADDNGFFKNHFLIDKPDDIKKTGDKFKSEMKDWNEFLKFSDNDTVINSKVEMFLDNEDGNDKLEKKKGMRM